MNISKISLGRQLVAVLSVILLIQIAISILSYRSIIQLNLDIDWVMHTEEVQHNMHELLSSVKDAETGQRGFVITGHDSYLEPYNNALRDIDVILRDLRELTADNPNQQERLDRLEPLIGEKLTELKATIDARRSDGFEAAQTIVNTDAGKQTMDEIRDLIDAMTQEEILLLAQREAATDAATQRTYFSIIGGGVVAVIFTIVAGIFLTRSIVNPLVGLAGVAEQIGKGDLLVELPDNQRYDEIGALSLAFRQMTKMLQRTTNDITAATQSLGSSASEILASTTEVATSTAESASAISETTTTVEEVRQAAQLSSQKAQTVSDSAQRVVQVSESGQNAVRENAAGMERIREQMESIAQTVTSLNEQSLLIGGIIATVTNLADQSNLLAVNSAIEAAKAGEQGKGFAVVAQEIKSLAEQSKQATNQVRAILNDVQKATNHAVIATEQGKKVVEAGVAQAAQAGVAITTLAETSNEAVMAATQIVASGQQQVVGMEQISLAMANINQAGTQNATAMKQLETEAQNLHQLGLKLKELLTQFKI